MPVAPTYPGVHIVVRTARGCPTVQDSPTGAPVFRLNVDAAQAAQAFLDQRQEQPLQ